MRITEIVGSINVHPSQIASQEASTKGFNSVTSTNVSTSTSLIDSISGGLAAILNASKWGKTDSNIYMSTPATTTPAWLIPAGIAAVGLVAIMALKK
jgi:uncharacterized membrane protein YidH (DUF202 family)